MHGLSAAVGQQQARPCCATARRSRGSCLRVAAARGMDRSSGMLTPHGSGDADVTDVISMARRRMSGSAAASRSAVAAPSGPMGEFLHKLKRAWEVFFPEEERTLSPKEEGKKRLRMILVADRCGMSADSLSVMRERIVDTMKDYVEVAEEEAVEVNLSVDPDLGTIYSVNVPVRRVKPQARGGMDAEGEDELWDPSDPDSDPSGQFPYGT